MTEDSLFDDEMDESLDGAMDQARLVLDPYSAVAAQLSDTAAAEAVEAEREAFRADLDRRLHGSDAGPLYMGEEGPIADLAKRAARSSDISTMVAEMTGLLREAEASRALPPEDSEPVIEAEVWTASIPSGVLMALADVSLGKRSADHEPAGINREAWRTLLRDQGLLR